MTSQTQANYLISIDGFENGFATVSELKAWADALVRRNPDLMGKSARIWKAISPGVFKGQPTRTLVIGA